MNSVNFQSANQVEVRIFMRQQQRLYEHDVSYNQPKHTKIVELSAVSFTDNSISRSLSRQVFDNCSY